MLAFMEFSKKFTGRLDEGLLVERGLPGVEMLVEPDVVDEVYSSGVEGYW